MAALPEDPTWEAEIYQLEDTDPVSGGTPNLAIGDGMDNVPHQQLARRTSWLKAQVDTLLLSIVAATTAVAGIVRLSTSTSSTSTTLAATPSAVKAAYDNAESRVPNSRLVATSGLAGGGGDLGADRTIDVPVATQAEAEAGAINNKAMTPLRVSQALTAALAAVWAGAVSIAGVLTASRLRLTGTGDVSLVSTTHAFQVGDDTGANIAMDSNEIQGRNAGAASVININNDGGDLNLGGTGSNIVLDETVSGTAIATQVEAEAGVLNTKIMTPLRVAQSVAAALSGILASIAGIASNGFIARTAAGTAAPRTFVGGNGITVSNGNGVAGNPTVEITGASQVEAEAGTSDARVMTPLRTAEAMAAAVPGVVAGIAAGGIGGTVFAVLATPATFALGATVAGSALRPASVGGAVDERSTGLSGTYRATGYSNTASTRAATWLRIA